MLRGCLTIAFSFFTNERFDLLLVERGGALIHHSVRLGSALFFRRLFALFRQPIFIIVTVVGHFVIAVGTLGLYFLERAANPKIGSLLDTLFWAIATVTTVGYGQVDPITPAGKCLGIGMMISGSILFWCYTALFATALVAPEMKAFENEVRDLERVIQRLEEEVVEKPPSRET
jgi:voltage-gated potassium channel Kch